jgi:receptor-type tyrosine-protein phosphatase F
MNFPIELSSFQLALLFDPQGKYECVAENTVGTEHSKPINLYVKIRRVPPQFSRPPDPVNEVLLGGNLNLTCVAVGSPMPFVKWRKGLDEDITPENDLPVGKSVLQLSDIRSSANYTCIASSSLGVIEALAMVKVQCKLLIVLKLDAER